MSRPLASCRVNKPSVCCPIQGKSNVVLRRGTTNSFRTLDTKTHFLLLLFAQIRIYQHWHHDPEVNYEWSVHLGYWEASDWLAAQAAKYEWWDFSRKIEKVNETIHPKLHWRLRDKQKLFSAEFIFFPQWYKKFLKRYVSFERFLEGMIYELCSKWK